MSFKSFTLGMGTGLIITAILFYVVALGLNLKLQGPDETEGINDEYVIDRAKQLGMDYVEDVQIGTVTDDNNGGDVDATNNNDIDNINTVDADPTTEVNGTNTSEETQQPAPYVFTDEQIAALARALGMDFVETQQPDNIDEPIGIRNDQMVDFDIYSGMSANRVAKVLADNDIVDDAKDFENYIIAKSSTTKIRTGRYRMVPGTPYEDILKVLTSPPK